MKLLQRVFVFTLAAFFGGLVLICWTSMDINNSRLFYALSFHRSRQTLKDSIREELLNLGHSTDFSGRITSQKPPSLTDHEVKDPSVWRMCSFSKSVQRMCLDVLDNEGKERHVRPYCNLENLAQDCGTLKKVHGYFDKPVDADELDFPLAFGIKMHTDPEQAEQLLRTIYRPHNVYCVHVDLQADDRVVSVIQAVAGCLPNVHLTARVNFFYAGIETVRIETLLMRCALESKVKWAYYLNLSGQEFPLRTNLELVRILRLFNGTNDIETFPMPTLFEKRTKFEFKRGFYRPWPTNVTKSPPPFHLPHGVRKGTQYNSFTRDFVEFFFTDKTVQSMLKYYADTYSPDETIYATLVTLPKTPGGYPVCVHHTPQNQHLTRAVVWKQSDVYQCQGESIRGICTFVMGDLPWLLQQPNLVANKFRSDTGSWSALACLEAVLYQRSMSRGFTVSQSIIANLPHVQYRRNHSEP